MLMQCCRDSGQATVSTRPQKAITACRGSSSILAERGLRPTSSLVASIILVSAAERTSKKFRLHFLPPQEASSASPAFLRPLRSLYYFPLHQINHS